MIISEIDAHRRTKPFTDNELGKPSEGSPDTAKRTLEPAQLQTSNDKPSRCLKGPKIAKQRLRYFE